jgi:hypothetical protein
MLQQVLHHAAAGAASCCITLQTCKPAACCKWSCNRCCITPHQQVLQQVLQSEATGAVASAAEKK